MPVARDPLAHGTIERLLRPQTNTRLCIRGQVGAIDRSKWGLNPKPSCVWFALRASVTSHTVAKRRQFTTTLKRCHRIGRGLLRERRQRSALTQQ